MKMSKVLTYLKTSRGIQVAVWSSDGLYELTFPYASESEARSRLMTQGITSSMLSARQLGWYDRLLVEMDAYFHGERVRFSVPIDWADYPEFRREVLRYTAEIPCGEVQSYGAIARKVGKPGAARAIGGAMHANRTPIVVPCHRVIGSDGSLTGFGGGLDLKQELLELERKKESDDGR
jgi:methylated-DNA-[protein]-cysteine S-methyltransferase